MKRSKLVTVWVALAMAFALVFGAVSVNAADPVKISFSLWDEVQRPVFDEIIAKFVEANPDIDVEIQLTPWGQYWTKLDAAAGAGEAPDVFWMNTFVSKYVDAGVLEPLDSYMDAAGVDRSAWLSTTMNSYSDDGVQYAMPKGMDTVVVAFNKKIFDKYEVAYPVDGWTWEDFAAKGAELRDAIAAAGGDEYAVVMEIDSPQPSYFQLLAQDGIAIFDESEKGTDLDSPDAVAAFADIVALIDEGILPDYKVLSDTKATDLFLSEKGAMVYVGSWKSSVLDEASFADQIGLVRMPTRKNGVCVIGGLGYSMSAYSKEKEAAWKLIEFLSGPESNRIQAEARIEIPAYLAEQDAYLPAFKTIDGSVFIEQGVSSVPFPSHRPLSTTISIVVDYASQIFAKEVTPEEGVAAMAEAVIEAVAEYRADM